MIIFFLYAAQADIKVIGNKRIEAETIKSYIPRESINDEEILNRTLKDLYSTGHFKDVQFKKENGKLIVQVVEQPIINKIAFEGNKKIKDADILQEIGFKPNQTLSSFKAIEAENKILQMYHYLGRYNVKVNAKTISLPDNRIDVVFVIDEGDKAYIRSIRFVGNKKVSTRELKTAIQSKEYIFYRFLSNDHYFNQERFQSDVYSIARYYRDHGFPDVDIKSAHSELNEDQSGFQLTFFINEGKKYNFGNIEIKNELQNVDMGRLKKVLLIQKGHLYSAEYIFKTLNNIIDELGHQGFNFVNVDHQETKKQDSIDIIFTIKKGKRVNIRKINIKGNTRTHDKVIRQYLLIQEQDSFNKHKLDQSERALWQTGYFSKINVRTIPVEEGLVDIEINVEETRTGQISFQIGYGTTEGPVAEIGFVENNLRGTGKIVHGSISVGQKEQDVTFGITDPRFKGRDVAVGFSVKSQRFAYYEYHRSHTTGVDVHTNYKLNPDLDQHWSYGIGIDNVRKSKGTFSDFSAFDKYVIDHSAINKSVAELQADPTLLAKAKEKLKGKEGNTIGNFLTSAGLAKNPNTDKIENSDLTKVGEEFKRIWNHSVRRDYLYKDDFGTKSYSRLEHRLAWHPSPINRFSKHRIAFTMNNNIAGLGGKVGYLHNILSVRYRYKISDSVDVTANLSYGMVDSFAGKTLRMVDTPNLGGSDIHGFDFAGIGPRDKATGIAVGGRRYYKGGVVLSFPLGLPEEYGIRAGVYSEFGAAYKSKFGNDPKIDDNASPRISLGVRLELNLPIGPLQLDYAIPIKKKNYDKTQRFMIGVSTRF